MGFNKVIGIGLPKTATSSLAASLTNNNIPTIHFGASECEEIREKLYRGIYIFDTMVKYRGITNAFEMVFPQIDKTYPNSKFIHTIRDKNMWLDSVEAHWDWMIKNPLARPMEVHHHLITFGTYLFNKDRFSYVYDTHLEMVNNYFKNRQRDLLILDVTIDQNYVYKVCDFLGISVIDATLVHANKGSKYEFSKSIDI